MSPIVAASIDLAATAAALAALVFVHLAPTGLSPLRDPVSQYGITPYRLGYRVLTVALGVAGLAAAVGVATGPTQFASGGRAGIVALLAVFGACRLVISWAPMDAPGAARSARGAAHIVLAIGAFVTAGAAAEKMQRAVQGTGPAMDAYRGALLTAFWLIVIGLFGQILLRRATAGRTGYGAVERLVYAGIFVLLTATGLALL